MNGGDRGAPQLAKNPYQISVMTNLFKLNLAENLMVHQYNLEIEPDEFWEADKVMRVLRTKWK